MATNTMDTCFRIAVLGAKNVGKTSLITRLTKKDFREKYNPTIEALFRYDIPTSETSYTKLEILDTAGDFEFPDMLRTAIRNSNAFTLVFDLSDPIRTFREVETLRQWIFEEGRDEVPIIVIGNKADLNSEQDTTDNKIIDAIVSIDWGCPYITTSAKDDVNISDMYDAVCKGLNIKTEPKPVINGGCKKETSKKFKFRRLSLF